MNFRGRGREKSRRISGDSIASKDGIDQQGRRAHTRGAHPGDTLAHSFRKFVGTTKSEGRFDGKDFGRRRDADYGKTWRPITPPSSHDGTIPIVTSADGRTFVAMTPIPQVSRDHGTSWTPVRGLPPFARVICDRVDPRRFYAVDFENGSLLSSDDAGVIRQGPHLRIR
jgi:hypothetical protein